MCPPAYVAYAPSHWSQGLGILLMGSDPQCFSPELKQHHLFHPYTCTQNTHPLVHTCVCMHTHSVLIYWCGHHSTQYNHVPAQHTCAHTPSCHTKPGTCRLVLVGACVCTHTYVHTQDTAPCQGGQSTGPECSFLAMDFSEDLRLTSHSDCLVYSELQLNS